MNTFGLGRQLNTFWLGTIGIEIIIPPKQPPSTGGGYGRIIRPGEFSKRKHREIIFVIRYNGKEWRRIYLWRDEFINAYIKVTGIMNTIINNIRISINKIKNMFNMIRIKR